MSAISSDSRPRSKSARSAKGSKKPAQPKFDELLPLIETAGDGGLALSSLKRKIIGTAGAQNPENIGELESRLDALVKRRAIHYLLKPGRGKQEPEAIYFADGYGPSVAKVSAAIAALAVEPDVTVFSRADLAKRIVGTDQLILDAAISEACRSHRVLALTNKKGVACYCAPGRAPSVVTAGAAISRLALEAGTTLLSKADLSKALTEFDVPFFHAAIERTVADKVLVQLTCGKAKAGAKLNYYYLHRDIAAGHFGWHGHGPVRAELTLDEILPAYRNLKKQQYGAPAVRIFDLLQALPVSKEDLHVLLKKENARGRVVLHHSTAVKLSPEVIDASVRMEGHPEPFVTVVVKGDLG